MIPFDKRDGKIWYNNELIDWQNVKLHVLSHGLHYASCVFEGLRVYDGEIFKLEEHTERFFHSAKRLGMDIPYDENEINLATKKTVAAQNVQNGYIRPFAWRGSEMMAGQTGLEFLSENKKKINTPVILLTAKGESKERIEGLEVGADDYLPKPFEPKELILRIRNILSKTKKYDTKRVIKFDNIKIDLNKMIIHKNNEEFKINNTEKIILEKMINSPGESFARDYIGNLIDIDKERSIDVIITRLRKKIEIDPKNPKYLQTIRGTGYVLWIE